MNLRSRVMLLVAVDGVFAHFTESGWKGGLEFSTIADRCTTSAHHRGEIVPWMRLVLDTPSEKSLNLPIA